MILQSVNDSYRSGNVMGFIGCGNERLIIESRFSGEEDDYFFQYLIDRVLDFPNLVDLETDANQDNRLFNFLLFLFPYYLKTAMRKGLFKEYIRHNYNDGYVKGTIDIARHIEKNTPFTGNVAYSQREFSYPSSSSAPRMVAKVRPWSCDNNLGTFSSSRKGGLLTAAIRAISKKRVPLVSSWNPLRSPAILKD